MKNTQRTTLLFLSAFLIIGSGTAYADHGHRDFDASDLLLGIATGYLVSDAARDFTEDRSSRSRRDRGYNHDSRNPSHSFGNRHDYEYSRNSATSEPIRGGSSRRTRIVSNPYPNRPLSGISFTGIDHDVVHINDVITYPRKRLTGIDHDVVHINDVITYPRKRLISHRSYSLSLFEPSRFLRTRGYVDYISVKAKRKEYFTVTFHYE